MNFFTKFCRLKHITWGWQSKRITTIYQTEPAAPQLKSTYQGEGLKPTKNGSATHFWTSNHQLGITALINCSWIYMKRIPHRNQCLLHQIPVDARWKVGHKWQQKLRNKKGIPIITNSQAQSSKSITSLSKIIVSSQKEVLSGTICMMWWYNNLLAVQESKYTQR